MASRGRRSGRDRQPGRSGKPDRGERSGRGRQFGGDDRAVSPVVGKAMEAAVVVLYVSALSATMYGGLVPEYRTAAGAEVGERVVAESAQRVQQAVPTDARAVEVRSAVSLPDTIRGEAYSLRIENRTLHLDHPQDGVDSRAHLALPETVASVEGEWSSREQAFVVVRTSADGDGLAVRLESGGDR